MTTTYWQLSFTSHGQFLGGYVTEAATFNAAYLKSILADIDPGGRVLGIGYTAESVDPTYLDRLLTQAEVEDMPRPAGFVDFIRGTAMTPRPGINPG